jgi:hypothetical protein
MEILDVVQVLAQHRDGADPLQLKRFSALEPRLQPYVAILCQPNGTIHACPARIGNADPASVRPMYAAFLNDAVTYQAQLAITPEYSVPWDVIRDIALVGGSPRPPHGSLWILGCESITPDELDAFQALLTDKTALRLIHEQFDPQRRAQAVYVDPVVFIFWATDHAGSDILCFLVQFKTVVSRDPDHVELHSLYLGNVVYKFTAQAGDVSLLALICSDAFEFSNALVDQHSANLLLIHIQLNQKPAYVDYAAYRARLFSVASNNNVEVICLNWAANLLIEGSTSPWNTIAGSAWYVAPHGIAIGDSDVNQLHRDGLYYSIVGKLWHAFYLNYAAHSLVVRKQPVYYAGVQVLSQRIPPQVTARRVWDTSVGAWSNVAADDGFGAFIKSYAPLAGMLTQLCQNDPLAIERALELLEGPLGRVTEWYQMKELAVLKVADEESLRRVTVSQEVEPTRQGVAFRRRRTRLAQTAATIPGQPVIWPTPVRDLADGFRYRWTQTEPHNNVEPVAGGRPAAFVYLGEDPEADFVSNVFAKLSRARQIHAATVAINAGADPNDAITKAQDRLSVVYRQNHQLQFHRPQGHASITDGASDKPDDIAGEHP